MCAGELLRQTKSQVATGTQDISANSDNPHRLPSEKLIITSNRDTGHHPPLGVSVGTFPNEIAQDEENSRLQARRRPATAKDAHLSGKIRASRQPCCKECSASDRFWSTKEPCLRCKLFRLDSYPPIVCIKYKSENLFRHMLT